jgi:hypothetical protein
MRGFFRGWWSLTPVLTPIIGGDFAPLPHLEKQRLQILGFEFAITFVVIAHINALHKQFAVMDLIG